MRRTMFVVPTGAGPGGAAFLQRSGRRPVAPGVWFRELGSGSWRTPIHGWPPWRTRWWICSASSGGIDRRRPRQGGRTWVAHPVELRGRQVLRRPGGHQQQGAEHPVPRRAGSSGAGPAGSWTGSRYVWAPIESWLPGGPTRSRGGRRPELTFVRQWLGRFGPGILADIAWWTGWNQGDTRRALAAAEATAEVDTSTAGTESDAGPLTSQASSRWRDRGSPCCPRWIPTPMGWYGRDWYLPADSIGPCCSTAPATSVRASGAMAGSSAAGRNGPDASAQLAAAGGHRRRPDRRGGRWRRPGSPTGWRGCG